MIREGVSVTVGVPGLMRTGSPRNALFSGDGVAESRWFTAAANLPLVSMDAERAARRLVKATLRRRPEIILTPLAKLGTRAHAIAPCTSLRLVSLVNRLLPNDDDGDRTVPGHRLRGHLRPLAGLARRDDEAAVREPRAGRPDALGRGGRRRPWRGRPTRRRRHVSFAAAAGGAARANRVGRPRGPAARRRRPR